MIRHIVMFQLKEENKLENIKQCFALTKDFNQIKSIQSFSVVANTEGTPTNNYDIALICDFASLEDLEKYQNDPIHHIFGDFIKQVRINRACIDYKI